ncbi:MAG TPA: DUF1206 domain-containing protein [Pyrinomonadaceae bacterium]|nr:DUF1206 domain-containing protein [Pyrinomonadaceae bacterium]
MTEAKSAVEEIGEGAREALEEVAEHPWMERLARFGYAAKGVVYIVVGILALLADFGEGGDLTDTRGAMRTIELQPFGKIILSVVAAGLGAYVLWRWVQAAADADNKGSDAKGLAIRTGYFFSGLVYAGLAFSAVRIVVDASGDDRGNTIQRWSGLFMTLPFGYLLVGFVGLCVIIFGLYQIYKGYKAKFMKRIKLHEMSRRERWTLLSGRFGYAARGVVFCIVGSFLLQAAYHFNPSEAKGLDGVLQTLPRQTFGTLLLAIIAIGLIAYGLFALVEARYRRIAGQ